MARHRRRLPMLALAGCLVACRGQCAGGEPHDHSDDQANQVTPLQDPLVQEQVAQDPAACAEGETSLAAFACSQRTLCPAIERGDDSVTLPEFLCVTQNALRAHASLGLSDVLGVFPARFRKNFTLKHGTKEQGLRGHVQELMPEVVSEALAQNSQSADLDFPRAIVWDEKTGFTLSFNGGLSESAGNTRTQTGAGRLDLLGFDREDNSFELWALDLPLRETDGALRPFQPNTEGDNCSHCHGPRSRPIWPMYPDWPGFFGSDNDELTKGTPHQNTELSFLKYFRNCVAPGRLQEENSCRAGREAAKAGRQGLTPADLVDRKGRYTFLFQLEPHLNGLFRDLDRGAIADYLIGLEDRVSPRVLPKVRTETALAAAVASKAGDDQPLREWMGLSQHHGFPYRPNHLEESAEASRAFFHRPNLRLGVLYNRLVALNLFEHLRTDPVYRAFKQLVVFSLMDCSWGDAADKQGAVLEGFREAAQSRLAARRMDLGDVDARDYRILYPVLLAALDLKVRDVDFRFSYPNRRFDRFDEGYRQPNVVQNVMAIGYIPYETRDYNAAHGAKLYFNSYFDGTATTNELLTALLLEDIARTGPHYRALFEPRSLKKKYSRFTARYALDRPFFEEMDALTPWLPLPYPKKLEHVHHRESFHKRIDGVRQFRQQYEAVCQQLREDL